MHRFLLQPATCALTLRCRRKLLCGRPVAVAPGAFPREPRSASALAEEEGLELAAGTAWNGRLSNARGCSSVADEAPVAVLAMLGPPPRNWALPGERRSARSSAVAFVPAACGLCSTVIAPAALALHDDFTERFLSHRHRLPVRGSRSHRCGMAVAPDPVAEAAASREFYAENRPQRSRELV